MARRRTPARRKDGRFTKGKSRARRNPPSKYRSKRRGTRKGQVRKTARRAYAPKPKRRAARRNQPMFTAPVRYSLLAGSGSIAGFWLDRYNIPGVTTLAAQVPMRAVTNSTVLGAVALLLGSFTLRGEARRNTMAIGVGAMVPTVGHVITGGTSSWGARDAVYGSTLPALWGGNGNGNGTLPAVTPVVGGVQNGGARGYTSRVPVSNPFLTTSRGLNVA